MASVIVKQGCVETIPQIWVNKNVLCSTGLYERLCVRGEYWSGWDQHRGSVRRAGLRFQGLGHSNFRDLFLHIISILVPKLARN